MQYTEFNTRTLTYGEREAFLRGEPMEVKVVHVEGRGLRAAGDTCPGCGQSFKGKRGLKAHQTKPYVAMACLPRED